MFKSKYAFLSETLILCCDVALIFLAVVVIDFLLYVLLNKFHTLHKIIKFSLLLVSACMFLSDLFTLYYFNVPVNNAMLNIILNTNLRESGEFMQVYLANINLWLFFSVVVIILFVLKKLFLMLGRLSSLVIVMGLVMGLLAEAREYHNGRGYLRLEMSFAVMRLYEMAKSSYTSAKLWNDMLNSAPLDIHLTKNDSTIPYVVFILGESTTRNHMQIYGYELPTTPLILQRQGHGLYAFTDTISAEAGTMASLQKIFTFYRQGAEGEWFMYANLISILNAAGYHTVWMSNQESYAVGGQHPAGFYSSRCDERHYTETLKDSGYRGGAYDEMLLPFLDGAMKSEHAKNFYVLHLMGAHFHYHKRYPESFEKFSASDEGGFEGINEAQKNTRAKYDNAILYNDFIIDEVIRRFEDKNAIVLYIADHGEEIYDTTNFQGHFEGIRSCVEIPFVVWVSEKFSAAYPELEARIAHSTGRPYMTDDIIHTVLDIMNIETPGYNPMRSIINDSFDATRKRIAAGCPYDTENAVP